MIAPYSFYVRFKEGDRIYQHYAFTSTPFRRREGDRVTVIYDSGHEDKPELLMLDSDWMAYVIIALAGMGVVALGLWLSHWPRVTCGAAKSAGGTR